ncbi:uncharacterized protein B0T15DRAFT_531359 [Chaetomium strumarium]|uniref:Uncharacterized protein n=1 Tax=Chaetomium strumarium TaxID=1170767 RepID=A0AAJ0GS45_9PEZI|nr:hypothetical protein B0T15DRAFT_531359 [Chaetomium strumarium]
MSDGGSVPGSAWFYQPSFATPMMYAGNYALIGAYHLHRCMSVLRFERFCSFISLTLRSSRFNWSWVNCCFFVSCVLYFQGYMVRQVARYLLCYNNVYAYLASTLPIDLAAPILIVANCCILAGTFSYVPHLSPIHPDRMVPVLGTLTAVVETIRVYLTLRAPSNPSYYAPHSLELTRASLALQLSAITLFYLLAARFHYRVVQSVRVPYYNRVRAVLRTLYVSMLLILVRTLYRSAAHFGGADAYALLVLSSGSAAEQPESLWQELFLFLFEAGAMMFNVIMWYLRHPKDFLPPPGCGRYLAPDGKTEVDGSVEGAAEKRKM